MTLDTSNPVIQLCDQGMAAETEGDTAVAARLFQQAWELSSNDYDRAVAAHYLARHQPTDVDVLHWTRVAVQNAEQADRTQTSELLPSLYLNLAASYVRAQDFDAAQRTYFQAADTLHSITDLTYAASIRIAIATGLQATGFVPQGVSLELLDLIERLTARSALAPLAMLLPAHLGNLGTDEDLDTLLNTLRLVHASRQLDDDEQQLLRAAIDIADAERNDQSDPLPSADSGDTAITSPTTTQTAAPTGRHAAVQHNPDNDTAGPPAPDVSFNL